MATMKTLLNLSGVDQDALCKFYLDSAKNIICDIRNTTEVESKYATVQIKMAIEMYNKMGVEGQVSHGENGISRGYENAGVSKSLLDEITPVVKTPFSKVTEVVL